MSLSLKVRDVTDEKRANVQVRRKDPPPLVPACTKQHFYLRTLTSNTVPKLLAPPPAVVPINSFVPTRTRVANGWPPSAPPAKE